jgi:phosphoglycerate dehydrogenase-like enzyme
MGPLRLSSLLLGLLLACRAPDVSEAERSSPEARTFFATGLSEAEAGELRAAAPGLRLLVLSPAEALERAAEADGADAGLCSDGFLERATRLTWVQAQSAGVEHLLARERLRASQRIVLTNMRGVHAPAMAEHVFAMLLSLTRQLPRFRAAQEAGIWGRDAAGMTALSGRTLLVVGLGSIGTEVARRAQAFDMRVLATSRTGKEQPPYVEHLGEAGDLDRLLPEADVVVITAPLTDETRGLFGAERLARLRPGAYLVNVGRGEIVDHDALAAALAAGRLAGACLDVTDPEPLPPEHPLWKLASVVITPHVSARAEITSERRREVLRENLRRFAAGEPLLNVVDKEAGY